MAPPTRCQVGPLQLDPVTLPEALDRIVALCRGAGGCVFTANVDHVMRAERQPAFAEAYAHAALALFDGMPVLWTARLLGQQVPEKVSGSTLVPALMARAEQEQLSVYFVGGRVGTAPAALARLRAQHPRLRVVGHSPPTRQLQPSMPAALEQEVMRMAQLRPDLVLVALGSPQQELWAHAVAARLRPAVLLCVGSALDQLAGLVRRAPAAFSRLGIEWLFRLLQEPRRLGPRYLRDDLPFLPLAARLMWQQRRRP